MNRSHLEYIRCAVCGGALSASDGGQIIEHGVVRCTACHMEFPVIAHVPRLLPGMVVAFIHVMRVLTTRLPLPLVLLFSRLCAVPAYLFFKLPHFILRRFQYIQEMNRLYPEHDTQNRKPDLDLLAHNWFDHFTPPVIGFYSDTEIYALLHGAPLAHVILAQGVVRASIAAAS